MENKALEIVLNYIQETYVKDTKENELFVTWSCYILGNRKYLIGWTKSNHYFEVTYNVNKNEWYLDVYNKLYNIKYDNNSNIGNHSGIE